MGMLSLAAKGRNGDTTIAHMTPGERVIPREVAELRPDLVAHIESAIRSMGGKPEKYVVGAGRVNPASGIEEFATEAEVRAAYQSVLGRAPEAEGLAYWMGHGDMNAFAEAAKPELASKVSDIYQSTFGRPAEDAGQNYWSSQINSGVISNYGDLSKTIAAGALGQDVTARNDIAGGGVDTKSTWNSVLTPYLNGNQNDGGVLQYDADKNAWGYNVPKKQVAQLPTATNATAATATASPWTVSGKQLVQNQLPDLLSQNNPLVQMAQTQGLESANARGLLNSSLGAEAGALAHYQYAMPIAQADASTEANAARANADNQTQANLTNAQLGTQVSLANANNANDIAKLGYTTESQAALQEKQNQFALQQLTTQQKYATQQSYLATLNAAQTAFQNFVNQIQVADMPEEAKTAQIQQAQIAFNSTIGFLDAAYSNMPNWQSEWSLAPATIQ